MEDNIYKVAFVEDMLFDLCVNKTMLLSPDKFLTEDDRDWFDIRLAASLSVVREHIAFLLAESDSLNCDRLCFTLLKRYRLHCVSLPIKIETALIDIVCGDWLREYAATDSDMAGRSLAELRRMAWRQDGGFGRKNNI